MQENKLEIQSTRPYLRAIEDIRSDLRVYGFCTENTKNKIIDEEKTHAAEIIASSCYSVDIPRVYELYGDDLVDIHGVSLLKVLDSGVDYLESGSDSSAGWQWELSRRKIERANLKSIVAMPTGVACIEISSTDSTKPEAELKNWGYSGSSFIRLTYRQGEKRFVQRNIMIDTSSLKKLNELRKIIEKDSLEFEHSEDLLANPQYVCVDDNAPESLSAKISNFSKNYENRSNPLRYMATIIRKSKKNNMDSWEFVKDHDIFEELFNEFNNLAYKNDFSEIEVNTIRAGAWQSMIDELASIDFITAKDSSIQRGIFRSRAVGAVFTSCGGTISFDQSSNISDVSFYDRHSIVSMLLDRVSGAGCCKSCGVTSMMYGCGVYCRMCNKVWCDEYVKNGRQLSDKEVLTKVYVEYFLR